ncbi:hypothetical protein APHAL10511_003610 [Amanita phalloides]|nr:hypothetical protein APHAL10511_003610 [Amanita phalloides]
MGADFRVAKDVFALVKAIVECLEEWGTGGSTGGTAIKLDILINNAAQTLTDSMEREEEQIRREWLLAPPDSDVREEEEDVGMMVEGPTSDTGNSLGVAGDGMVATTTGYVPRLRGGQFESARTLIENNPFRGQARQSSWVQRMAEIPYEDVISAHSINTFVPFILIRELMPLMRRDRHHHHHQQPQQDDMSVDSEERKPGPRKPTAYIINVSSREGLPERHIGNQPKDGQHVHTNMSKAALNMLTETEARKAWKGGRVAMNAVDPGYMSADPAWMKRVGRENEQPPLSWEDGVGRVLWAVAKGETENVPVWGKFLKHFVEIDPRR